MGLGKWLALAGGIAGTAFTGNPTFAMMGVSGFNALNNKEGVDKAVGQQQAATNQALGANEQALGPYVQRGNTAGNTLMGLMGLGPLPGQPGFDQTAKPPAQDVAPMPLPTVKGAEGGGENVPSDAPSRRLPMVQNPDATMTQASLSSQSGYGPRFGGLSSMGGGLVPVRGPNGQTYRIPPDRLEEALSQGGVQL